jgi:dihydroorotate dehydrogenase (NAD+) catalytic subunit
MIAAGTFGYDGFGRGMPPELDLSLLGAVIPKTVSRHPREGNPEPRWHPKSYRRAFAAGEFVFLNSVGLANPGIEAALSDAAPQWTELGTTVLLSLAAESVEEFGEMTAMTQGIAGFQALEINLSCPNVENGAMFSHSAKLAADAVGAVRAKTELPVLAKLAPNVPDITEIARAAVDAGADALTIGNTIPAMSIDVETRQPVLGAGTGGLSGHGLRPVSLALVYRTAQAVDVPIIGCGGIFEAAHAVEYILAGATAVQVGSANLVDMGAPFRILEGLREYLEQAGLRQVGELIGAVRAGDTA